MAPSFLASLLAPVQAKEEETGLKCLTEIEHLGTQVDNGAAMQHKLLKGVYCPLALVLKGNPRLATKGRCQLTAMGKCQSAPAVQGV